MTDMEVSLWHEASYDHEASAHEAALDIAGAHMASVMPFLLQAATPRELDHRLSFAAMRLNHISAQSGVAVEDLEAMARRHFAILKQALPEGTDPMTMVMQAPQGGYGSGPLKPDEHDEGPDFAGSYSEVPMGAPGGPVPQVTVPVFPGPQQVSETTAAMRRTADNTAGTAGMSTLPAGSGTAPVSPDGASAQAPQTAMAPLPGTQTSGGPSVSYNTPPAQGPGMLAARRDPVADQIRAVASSVRASNPQLAESECRRIARRVVGGYLRHADMASSVTSDAPWATSPGAQQQSGGSGGGGGTGPLGHMLEWQGLKSMMPGGGTGGGVAADVAEAGEALL